MADEDDLERVLAEVEADGSERERHLADVIRALRAALAERISDNGPEET